MDPLKAQMNRLHAPKRKQRRKDIKTMSHQDETSVDQWIEFMATLGYKLQEKRQSSISDKWMAKVFKYG